MITSSIFSVVSETLAVMPGFRRGSGSGMSTSTAKVAEEEPPPW